jgi:hypothetical protein
VSQPYDEIEMSRFILGELSPEERERVEERFMTDHDYFEALCAFEESLTLQAANGELDEPLRRRFEAAQRGSPELGREVRRLRAFVDDLRVASRPPTEAKTPASRRGWTLPLLTLAVAATVVLGVWLMVRRPVRPVEQTERPPFPATPEIVLTKLLLPGNLRARGNTGVNTWAIAPAVQTVELRLVIPMVDLKSPVVTITRVGGGKIEGVGEPAVTPAENATELTVRLSASRLPPQDYELSVTAGSATGVRTAVAERSFKVTP